MTKDIDTIRERLTGMLKAQGEVLRVTSESEKNFEVTGTVPAMQGKKKVDGIYFASVVPKPKDVRFYYFPLYTHRDQLIDTLSGDLKKCLKGKSCFHIKALTPELEAELKRLVEKGVELYREDGLLEK